MPPLSKIVVCASGEGTNFQAIAEACRQGRIHAEVTGLIASRSGCGAIQRAGQLGIPSAVLAPKAFEGRESWDRALLQQLGKWQADWVVLAGYLCLVGPEVLGHYSGRMINSHPALLPKYGGQGMFGIHVHRAVLKAQDKETGVTIHLIDAEYDRGKILAQERIAVREDESPEQLERRVKALEIQLYPRVLNDLVTGRITTG